MSLARALAALALCAFLIAAATRADADSPGGLADMVALQGEAFDVSILPAEMTVPAGLSFPAMAVASGLPDTEMIMARATSSTHERITAGATSLESGLLELEVSVGNDTPLGPHTVTVEVQRSCIGSCRGGSVSIADLVAGVNIALGLAGSNRCPALDVNGDAVVSVAELIRAVRASLGRCFVSPDERVVREISLLVVDPDPPTDTPTPTSTPTPTPMPAEISVAIETDRGCGTSAMFVPGDSTVVRVEMGGSPVGLPIAVNVLANTESELGTNLVSLFSFRSEVGRTVTRRIEFDADDASSIITLIAQARAEGLVTQDQCRTTIGSGAPASARFFRGQPLPQRGVSRAAD